MVALAYSKDHANMPLPLAVMDGRAIEVTLDVAGRSTVVYGSGIFEMDSELGGILRILVNDAEGSFEIVLREAEWRDEILLGIPPISDYRVRLTQADYVPRGE